MDIYVIAYDFNYIICNILYIIYNSNNSVVEFI